MFMKTMAVGPFEPGATPGATVALPLLHRELYEGNTHIEGAIDVTRLAAHETGMRRAIVQRIVSRAQQLHGKELCFCQKTTSGHSDAVNNVHRWECGVAASSQ